ncbi:MAG: hypothetical protein JW768_14035 [Chitinispirillaceae bacterium]|nr:hypothetical protein [Chitinispirillaceae bacterium]
MACGLIGCNNGGTGPDQSNDPAFSNVSPLESIYVTYPSPDQSARKDTLVLTFDYNSSKVSSIVAQLTLDSGKTWNIIATITPSSSNKGTVTWIPKDSSSAFMDYFGIKEGYIQLLDLPTNAWATTDTFQLYGSRAVELTNPSGIATYSRNDTIRIEFGQNQDISGFFSVYFRSDSMIDWVLVNEMEKESQSLPFKFFLTKLVPQVYIDEANLVNGNDFREPIIILVADYLQNSMVYSDYITITQ